MLDKMELWSMHNVSPGGCKNNFQFIKEISINSVMLENDECFSPKAFITIGKDHVKKISFEKSSVLFTYNPMHHLLDKTVS